MGATGSVLSPIEALEGVDSGSERTLSRKELPSFCYPKKKSIPWIHMTAEQLGLVVAGMGEEYAPYLDSFRDHKLDGYTLSKMDALSLSDKLRKFGMLPHQVEQLSGHFQRLQSGREFDAVSLDDPYDPSDISMAPTTARNLSVKLASMHENYLLSREASRRNPGLGLSTHSTSSVGSQMSLRMIALRNQNKRDSSYYSAAGMSYTRQGSSIAPAPFATAMSMHDKSTTSKLQHSGRYSSSMVDYDEEERDDIMSPVHKSSAPFPSSSSSSSPEAHGQGLASTTPPGDEQQTLSSSHTTIAAATTQQKGFRPTLALIDTSPAAGGYGSSRIPNAATAGTGVGHVGLKRPPALKLGIQDDADWIQVDDEEGDVLTPRKKKPVLSPLSLTRDMEQSYMFTQSGTIFVEGFKEGIGREGIQMTRKMSSMPDMTKPKGVPMRDRLVILSQLGHGASGVVYKALDITEMKIVALKMISVFDKGKRRQMVIELGALFQVFRQKKQEFRKAKKQGGKMRGVLSQLKLKSPKNGMGKKTPNGGAVVAGNAAAAPVVPMPQRGFTRHNTTSGLLLPTLKEDQGALDNSTHGETKEMLASASLPVLGMKKGFTGREEKDGVGDGVVTTSSQWQLLNNSASSADGNGNSSGGHENVKIIGPSSSSAARSSPQSIPSSSSQLQENSNHQHVKPTAGDSNNIPGQDIINRENIDNNNRNSHNHHQWDEKESKNHSAAAAAWEERKEEGKHDKDKSKPWVDDSYHLSPPFDTATETITTTTATATATMTGVNGVSPVGIADAKLSFDNLSGHTATTPTPPHATSDHVKPSTPPPPFLATYPQVNPHSLPVTAEHTNGDRNRVGTSRDVDHEAQAKSPFQTVDHYDSNNNKSGADGAVNRAGEKDDAQTKQLDAKLGTDGNSNDNNKSLLHTEASESKSSGTTTLVNDSISEVNEGDEAAFELSPGLEKFFAKPAMDYVVDFYDAFSNIDDGGVAIMMEYMDGGSLQDIVDDGGCDDEITLANIAVQLHRDLKPGNFLISHRGDVKVADLGILRQLEDPLLSDKKSSSFVTMTSEDNSSPGSSNGSLPKGPSPVASRRGSGAGEARSSFPSPSASGSAGVEASSLREKDKDKGEDDKGEDKSHIPHTKTFVGTVTFMAPERIDGREYSYPSDVWAFGLSMMTVALGRLPIDTKGGYWTILHCIRDADPPTLPEGRFSPQFQDFLHCCLQKDPTQRQTCNELLLHPFLRNALPEECGMGDGELDLDEVGEVVKERGASELESVINALHEHLSRLYLQVDSNSNNPSSSSESKENKNEESKNAGKSESKQESKRDESKSGGECDMAAMPLHPFFDELKRAPSVEHYLRQFLLGGHQGQGHHLPRPSPEKGTTQSASLGSTESDAAAAQRLATLAYQLHLPIEGLIKECDIICTSLLSATPAPAAGDNTTRNNANNTNLRDDSKDSDGNGGTDITAATTSTAKNLPLSSTAPTPKASHSSNRVSDPSNSDHK